MNWDECLKRRIAKRISKDSELIKSLIKTSKNKTESEEKLKLTIVTSASKISLAYDSLREILEALSIKEGYKVYNHECYTYFLKEILKQSLNGDEFDELRRIRNSINYYGKDISIKEAEDILNRIKKLRNILIKFLK